MTKKASSCQIAPFGEINSLPIGDITAIHALRRAPGLFINDSINLACVQWLTLTGIITMTAP